MSTDTNAELLRLRAENAALKTSVEAAAKRKIREVTMKVGQSGCACLYGLGRFPVSLYKEQWVILLNNVEGIKQFLAENDKLLVGKDSLGNSVLDGKIVARVAKPKV